MPQAEVIISPPTTASAHHFLPNIVFNKFLSSEGSEEPFYNNSPRLKEEPILSGQCWGSRWHSALPRT